MKMKIKETYIDMPYASGQQQRIWKYFNKPGQHCNKHDRYSPKWKPQVYSFPSGPGIYSIKQDQDDLMWEKIKFECVNSLDTDCSNPNSFECKQRRHYKCSASDPHFPADVEAKDLVNHLKEYHPEDYTKYLRSVKFTMKIYNKNSKNNLKLSHGIISEKNKQVIFRFPLSRSSPVRHDDTDDDDIDDESIHKTMKEAYKNNPVGAYAGNYQRPLGSQGYNADLPDKFTNFVNYRHNPTNSCHIFDINKNKYKARNIKEKIDSYIIKEEAIALTLAGPVTEIDTERVVYTCHKYGCKFPCLCHICVHCSANTRMQCT